MTKFKKIVCLSNSRKWRGRCVAGKIYKKSGQCGNWIRPVSKCDKGELSLDDICYENDETPKVLDIIIVPVLADSPQSYQCENYLIDDGVFWEKVGEFPISKLDNLCDDVDTLWINGYSSYNGINDKIPYELARDEVADSLLFIKLDKLTFLVRSELYGKKVRADFLYCDHHYRLAVTYSLIENYYLSLEEGSYELSDQIIYLCISLGEQHSDGFCYKLIAGVIY
jgi:hypothetical protein